MRGRETEDKERERDWGQKSQEGKKKRLNQCDLVLYEKLTIKKTKNSANTDPISSSEH